MTARRRRIGSESEQQQPLILIDSAKQEQQQQQHPSLLSHVLRENGATESRLPHHHLKNSSSSSSSNNSGRMSRDRTNEFASAVRSLQGRHLVRVTPGLDQTRTRIVQDHSYFMSTARTISRDIANVYTKLEKLTLLAKRKPLFNDQPTEIQELTYIIKEDLCSLNGQIADLEKLRMGQNEHSSNRHLGSHSSNVVVALQSKLANMSSQFNDVLELRKENVKEANRRREHFSQDFVSGSLPQSNLMGGAGGGGPQMRGGPHQGSVLFSQDNIAIDVENSTHPNTRQSNNIQQQLVMYDQTDSYLTSRAETMQNIESTIVELGAIFQQLAHMVTEQEEMVDRIDMNIQDTELNVDMAHSEIVKYFQSVTSNRWLMIKIFAVLIFFFMFFLIFVA